MTKSELLFTEAIKWLGKDASPKDKVTDDLACVDSIEQIHHRAFGEYICPPYGEVSTLRLYDKLKVHAGWRIIQTPTPGALILSPSGMSSKNYKHGHIGIVGLGNMIMSNDSRSGIWIEGYSLQSWHHVFEKQMGFPVFYFEKI